MHEVMWTRYISFNYNIATWNTWNTRSESKDEETKEEKKNIKKGLAQFHFKVNKLVTFATHKTLLEYMAYAECQEFILLFGTVYCRLFSMRHFMFSSWRSFKMHMKWFVCHVFNICSQYNVDFILIQLHNQRLIYFIFFFFEIKIACL